MRKIGTITTAISFIFLGVALLLSKFNGDLAYTVFKFWPMMIIVLGLEFLYISYKNKDEAKSYKFSFLTIFVLIVFLITDSAWGLVRSIDFESLKSQIENSIGYSNTNKVAFRVEKELSKARMILRANNADIDIKPSKEKKLIFDGYIQAKNNKGIDEPTTYFREEADKLTLDLNREPIGGIEGTLYVPNGISIEIIVNNGKIESEEDLSNAVMIVDSKNAYVNLKNLKEAHIKNSNGDIEISNINDSSIENVNGSVKVNGNSENVDIDNKNGAVIIDNDISRNIKVRSNTGDVRLRSDSADAVLKATTDYGTIRMNGNALSENKQNLNKTLGNGNGNINIWTKSGDIDIEMKE